MKVSNNFLMIYKDEVNYCARKISKWGNLNIQCKSIGEIANRDRAARLSRKLVTEMYNKRAKK